MKVLLQGSFITSLVLVSSMFDGVSAAKVVPVQISQADIVRITQAIVVPAGAGTSAAAVNVFNTLLEFYNSNPDLFQNISDVYNNFKAGKIPQPNIPADIYNKIPANVAGILCIKNGDVYQINPTVCNTLDLLIGSIKDGIDAAQSKTCKACCQNFWCKTAPKILLMSVSLLGPVLEQIFAAKTAMTKFESTQNLTIHIPANAIVYGAVR